MDRKPAGDLLPRHAGRHRLVVLLVIGAGVAAALSLAGSAAAQSPDEITRALEAVYGDRSIQRALEVGIEQPSLPEPPAPHRLPDSGTLNGMGVFILWTLAAAIGLAGLAMAVNELPFLARNFRKTKAGTAAGTPNSPDDPTAGPAVPDIDEVDRLAGEGHFGEAVHLLLLRAISTLKERLESGIVPALTSREVQAVSGLPGSPGAALDALVQTVERSHFGGRPVTEQDYQRCRDSHGALLNVSPDKGRAR